jgi:glutamate---cysteine ligase / carboxylate-amine ligase
MHLNFTQNEKTLTLGVEMEIQLVDNNTLRLTPKAPEILRMLQHQRLTKEMFRSTLELITGICSNVHEVHKDLTETLQQVRQVGEELNLSFAGTGTHPLADYNNRILSPTPRYHELLDRNQWLIKRMAVYGLHVHLGMRDGDSCIQFNNFFLHFVPHMIALSASSPFWRGQDTGLAACRPTAYEAHPTSGLPEVVGDWTEFNHLYQMLIQTGSIQSMKDLWWDMRPSPGYGTLEIRICDGPATMLELESIVAWIHVLAHWFEENTEDFYSRNNLKPYNWVLRENKWRALRYGIDAEIISHESLETIKLSAHITDWLEKLDPYFVKLGYEKYAKCLKEIVLMGNSAARQRKVMTETDDIYEVIKHNIAEFNREEPLWL